MPLKGPQRCSITVITATLNAADTLPRLISDLENQSDQDFFWIIKDGGSSDQTISLLESARIKQKKLLRSQDTGIYDALNQAIQIVSTSYYLVIGADDRLFPGSISNYKESAMDDPWMVSAGVLVNGCLKKPGSGKRWLHGMSAFVSSHSVGLMIRRDLHDRLSLYETRYSICEDQRFVKVAVDHGYYVRHADFVAGEYFLEGFSNKWFSKYLFEFFCVQVETEKSYWLQLALYVLRMIKNNKRIRIT